MTIKLWWWRWRFPTELNFGDELTGSLLERLTRRPVRWVPIEDADVVGAGSVLIQVTKKRRGAMPYVWGSGFIQRYQGEIAQDRLPAALRGRLSRSLYPEAQADLIRLGDPGILAGHLVDGPVSRKYALGVVPHYKDAADPLVARLGALGSSVRLIDVAWTPEEVAREIASCDAVLSSSLHGLIFADALGVPNAHLRISERVGGDVHGSFKFEDYYSAFDERAHTPWYPADVRDLDVRSLVRRVHEAYQPPTGIESLQQGLLEILPDP